MPSLHIRLLGGFDVRVDDRPLPPLRSRREQWLLALLVLRADRDTERAWLATVLWPDNDEAQALFYLRKGLSNLRQALGAAADRLLAPTPRTLRLDLTDAFVDVAAFDRAIAGSQWDDAVRHYQGALLPGCLEEWALVERTPREQAFLSALETLAARCRADGDPAGSVPWLRQLVAADPYRESAHASLMQALSDCGDTAAVTAVYQELRARLRQELNASPSAETEALYRRLRQPRPPAPPPPVAAPPSRRHLPVPLSERIGRDGEVAEMLNLLARRRLVTLLGTGGVGKTRLAIAVADAALPRFDHGVWFVDLAPLTDPERVPGATARALGIAEQAGRPLVETLAESLAPRSLLLVLDNCEHLIDACAQLAQSLLNACPDLRLLATSRQALEVGGEQVFRVPSLPVPPDMPLAPEKDPHFLMEYDAVRLFVDRAVRAHAPFRLTPQNAPQVARICRRLDGIPLAIEMAAARLRSLSVGEIQSRLDDRFALLTRGNRGALPRQQTLRAAIDWSWDQLTEGERTLWRQLSVFAGGWTRESAEAVCDDPEDVAETLAALVERSLVLRREESDGSVRYGMLETIRQYGRERLEAGPDADAIPRRHRDHCVAWAEAQRKKQSGPERAAWLAAMDAEHDNLREALDFCRRDPESGDAGLRLGSAIWSYWRARGYLSEGRARLAEVLAHPDAQAPSVPRSDALNGAGILALSQGDNDAAQRWLAEGLALCRRLEQPQLIATALANLGMLAAIRSDYAAALTYTEEALQVNRALGNRHSQRVNLNNLGLIRKELGDYDGARAHFEESLALDREEENRSGIAATLNNLGILAETRGDLAAARALYEESLTLHRELGPRAGEASNLAGLGGIARRRGDLVEARALYEESLAIRRETGDVWGVALALQGLGVTVALQGDPAAGRALLEESLVLHQKVGSRIGVVETLRAFASLARLQQRFEAAARLWGAAEALGETLGATIPPHQRAEVEGEASLVRESLGDEAFAAAWQAGRALSEDEAVADALARA